MPRNPEKQKCQYPGCRAWSMHGSAYCVAHQPTDSAHTASAASEIHRALQDLHATEVLNPEAEIRDLIQRRRAYDAHITEMISHGEEVNWHAYLDLTATVTGRVFRMIRQLRKDQADHDKIESLLEDLRTAHADRPGVGDE